MKINTTAQDECRAATLKRLKPGDTLYTVLRHVSRSGGMRQISALHIKQVRGHEPKITQFDNALEVLCGFKQAGRDGNIIYGGGMDMGFHLVYKLSTALWPDGFTCPGERCRSNDHTNGDRNYKPHHHRDGGYALRQVWF